MGMEGRKGLRFSALAQSQRPMKGWLPVSVLSSWPTVVLGVFWVKADGPVLGHSACQTKQLRVTLFMEHCGHTNGLALRKAWVPTAWRGASHHGIWSINRTHVHHTDEEGRM